MNNLIDPSTTLPAVEFSFKQPVIDQFTESDEARQQRLLRYVAEDKIEVELLRIGAPTEATGKTFLLTEELTSEIARLNSGMVLSEYGNPIRTEVSDAEWVERICVIDPLNVCGSLSDVHIRAIESHLYLYGAFQAVYSPHATAETIIAGLLDGTLMMSMRAFTSSIHNKVPCSWNVIKLVTFDVVPGHNSEFAKAICAEREAASDQTNQSSTDENENTMSEVKAVEAPAVFSIEAMAQAAMAASLNYVQPFIHVVKPIKYLGIVQQRPVHIEVSFIECTDAGVKFTIKHLNTEECITFEHVFGNATVALIDYVEVGDAPTMTLVEVMHVFNHTLVELVRLTETLPAAEA